MTSQLWHPYRYSPVVLPHPFLQTYLCVQMATEVPGERFNGWPTSSGSDGKGNTYSCFSNDQNGYSPFATYGLEISFWWSKKTLSEAAGQKLSLQRHFLTATMLFGAYEWRLWHQHMCETYENCVFSKPATEGDFVCSPCFYCHASRFRCCQ